MCLVYLLPIPKKLKKEHGERVGWKIYRHEAKGSMVPQFEGHRQLVGVWLDEKWHRGDTSMDTIRVHTIYPEPDFSYKTGFHIYLSEAQVFDRAHCDEIVRKVYFRKPVAYGKQNNCDIIVAKQLKILRRRAKCA